MFLVLKLITYQFLGGTRALGSFGWNEGKNTPMEDVNQMFLFL